jgi:hypothetical protein
MWDARGDGVRLVSYYKHHSKKKSGTPSFPQLLQLQLLLHTLRLEIPTNNVAKTGRAPSSRLVGPEACALGSYSQVSYIS